MMLRPKPIKPGPGQESVWDYPRPPRLEQVHQRVRIEFGGVVVADTTRAFRVLETSHPPVYYIPPDDIEQQYVVATSGSSFCEWKGKARYVSLQVGDARADSVGWFYPEPSTAFAPIRDHVAFYAGPMDRCTVGDARVAPQPGGFYGGWITDDVVGPFKGEPGTHGW